MGFKIRGRHFDAFNVAVVVVTLVWLAFQVWVPAANRPPALDQAFMVVLGGWVSSRAIQQNKKDERISIRVDRLSEAVAETDSRAVVSEERADAAQERESQWSQHKDHHESGGE